MFRDARFSVLLLLLAYIGSLGTVLAASPPHSDPETGISYITGGIGEDEVQEFRAAAPRYNLRMTFASKAGNYLSDVDVTITAGSGRHLLFVRTEGPFLFVRMPAGTYRITAQTSRTSESRTIRVPARGSVDMRFSWDDRDDPRVLHLCKHCSKTKRP